MHASLHSTCSLNIGLVESLIRGIEQGSVFWVYVITYSCHGDTGFDVQVVIVCKLAPYKGKALCTRRKFYRTLHDFSQHEMTDDV